MRIKLLTAAGIASLAFLLTACGATAVQDRGSGGGKEPDRVGDASQVELYRNADNIPNVAYFCAGAYGWASTLSGGSGENTKPPQLIRFPEYDEVCSLLDTAADAPAGGGQR